MGNRRRIMFKMSKYKNMNVDYGDSRRNRIFSSITKYRHSYTFVNDFDTNLEFKAL